VADPSARRAGRAARAAAASWLVLAVAAPPAAAAGRDCDGGVCLEARQDSDGAELALDNPLPAPVHVRVELLDLTNAAALPGAETTAVVAPGEQRVVARVRVRRDGRRWRYRYRWRYLVGDPAARHDDAVRYAMPFGGRTPRSVSQGALGSFSHRGETAFDFRMPEGTPVLAAREGVVARVVDGFVRGGARRGLADEANRVLVLHEDGTLGRYLHLRRGVPVEVGERIVRGQLLGYSGHTGYSTEPHLHFDVVRATGEGRYRSVPIRFASDDPEGFVPRAGGRFEPQERVLP